MSIFKKLVKNIFSEVKSAIDTSTAPTASANNRTPSPAVEIPRPQTHLKQGYPTDDAYFAALIKESNFPDYTIERNVHPSVFDSSAHPKCYPISYLFKKGGVPILAVLVMNQNQSRAMIAKGTYDILDNEVIPYIRFYKGMENKEYYVISRINENL
ncbi:MAG: hypothetical protein IJA55_07220 [Clostridia bacterium]|nr:hypothetical protein [Clostridia bacterium]